MQVKLYPVILAIIGVFFVLPSHAQDEGGIDYSILDNEKGTSVQPVVAVGAALIEGIEAEGMEIVRLEYDLLFDTKTSFRDLHEGWTYGIIAFGDYRFKDIDLTLYKDVDNTWVEIEKDASAESTATIIVTPSATGSYKIEIKAYSFQEGYSGGRYGLMIFHE